MHGMSLRPELREEADAGGTDAADRRSTSVLARLSRIRLSPIFEPEVDCPLRGQLPEWLGTGSPPQVLERAPPCTPQESLGPREGEVLLYRQGDEGYALRPCGDDCGCAPAGRPPTGVATQRPAFSCEACCVVCRPAGPRSARRVSSMSRARVELSVFQLEWVFVRCRVWRSSVAGLEFDQPDFGPQKGAPGSALDDIMLSASIVAAEPMRSAGWRRDLEHRLRSQHRRCGTSIAKLRAFSALLRAQIRLIGLQAAHGRPLVNNERESATPVTPRCRKGRGRRAGRADPKPACSWTPHHTARSWTRSKRHWRFAMRRRRPETAKVRLSRRRLPVSPAPFSNFATCQSRRRIGPSLPLPSTYAGAAKRPNKVPGLCVCLREMVEPPTLVHKGQRHVCCPSHIRSTP